MAIPEIVTLPSSRRPDQNFGQTDAGSGRSELDIRAGLSGTGAREEQSIITPEKAGRRAVVEPQVNPDFLFVCFIPAGKYYTIPSMTLETAEDIQNLLKTVLSRIQMQHIDHAHITCFRSRGAKTRAIARIWSLPRIYQLALNVKPHYAIEFISEKFDKQDHERKVETIIHELLHIPKNFSGALRPHKAHKWSLHKEIKVYLKQFQENRTIHP